MAPTLRGSVTWSSTSTGPAAPAPRCNARRRQRVGQQRDALMHHVAAQQTDPAARGRCAPCAIGQGHGRIARPGRPRPPRSAAAGAAGGAGLASAAATACMPYSHSVPRGASGGWTAAPRTAVRGGADLGRLRLAAWAAPRRSGRSTRLDTGRPSLRDAPAGRCAAVRLYVARTPETAGRRALHPFGRGRARLGAGAALIDTAARRRTIGSPPPFGAARITGHFRRTAAGPPE